MKRRNIIILTALVSLLVGCANDTPNISDDGTVLSVQDYDITMIRVEGEDSFDIDGKYTGEIVDGKPQGEGTFKAESENGSVYVYEGEFSDGRYDGYGMTTITNDGETLQMAGTYTKGEFTPTTGESFNFIGQLGPFGKFTIPETVIEYIDSSANAFPITTKETIQSADIQEFSSKQFIKTRKQEQIGLVKLDLYAIQVFEDDYFNGKLTSLLAADDGNNYYAMYYLGSTEVYDEDAFTAYAIPCTTSSFDNISGGTTNVIVMAACYIAQ